MMQGDSVAEVLTRLTALSQELAGTFRPVTIVEIVARVLTEQLAPGLKAVAWADDGVIEGAEPANTNEAWIVAVQWHPEDLTERALFEGFAQAVT